MSTSARAIASARFSIPVPDGGCSIRPGSSNGLEELSRIMERLGFVRLPPLELPSQLWVAYAHPAGATVSGLASTAGLGPSRVSSLVLRASLDLGCFHSISAVDGIESFHRMLDGSCVGVSRAPESLWTGDLFQALRRLQSRGHLRSFAKQFHDLRQGVNAPPLSHILPDRKSWSSLPKSWRDHVEELAPAGFVDALSHFVSTPASLSWERIQGVACLAINGMRAHARHTSRRYWPQSHRENLERWVLQIAQSPRDEGAGELDFHQVSGGLSQLLVWTWMAQQPEAHRAISQWLEKAPMKALREAVLPGAKGLGWGDHLSISLMNQQAQLPALGRPIEGWLDTLRRRLGDEWATIWSFSPLEPVGHPKRWSLVSHAQAPSSFSALARAIETLGAQVSPPSSIADWNEGSWADVFDTQAKSVDWSPVRTYVLSRCLSENMPASSSRRRPPARF